MLLLFVRFYLFCHHLPQNNVLFFLQRSNKDQCCNKLKCWKRVLSCLGHQVHPPFLLPTSLFNRKSSYKNVLSEKEDYANQGQICVTFLSLWPPFQTLKHPKKNNNRFLHICCNVTGFCYCNTRFTDAKWCLNVIQKHKNTFVSQKSDPHPNIAFRRHPAFKVDGFTSIDYLSPLHYIQFG